MFRRFFHALNKTEVKNHLHNTDFYHFFETKNESFTLISRSQRDQWFDSDENLNFEEYRDVR